MTSADNLSIAYQGEPGAYSEEAIRHAFPPATRALPQRTFADVGDAVARGEVELGLLPIENTLAGSVTGTYDVLADTALEVTAEVVLPIHHCVLGMPGASLDALARVLSHPVALAQCTRLFRERPGMRAEAVYDTAGAAREVARLAQPTVGAIAGAWTAERHALTILAENVEDRPDNQTRFLVMARAGERLPAELAERAGARPPSDPGEGAGANAGSAELPMKTAVLLEVRNEPGALLDVLKPFAARGVNLSKLESRPTGKPWTYRFFLELDADAALDAARQALDEVRTRALRMRVLGSFTRIG